MFKSALEDSDSHAFIQRNPTLRQKERFVRHTHRTAVLVTLALASTCALAQSQSAQITQTQDTYFQ